MAVDIKTQEFETPSLKAYLRSAAEQELTNLKTQMEMRANRENYSSSEVNMPNNNEDSPLASNYRISQEYGNYNPNLYAGRTAGARHQGLDVATPSGTLVKSPFAGIVKTGQSKDFGNFVEIRTQDGRLMRFSHLQSVDDLAKRLGAVGQQIQAGQTLGSTGSTGYSTGPHLDIMYQQGGQWTNPLNYEPLRRTLGR